MSPPPLRTDNVTGEEHESVPGLGSQRPELHCSGLVCLWAWSWDRGLTSNGP